MQVNNEAQLELKAKNKVGFRSDLLQASKIRDQNRKDWQKLNQTYLNDCQLS
jgi:hypothetical protein